MKEEVPAEEYIIGHWAKNKIYTHLSNMRHQARFTACVDLMEGRAPVCDVGCAMGHSTADMKKKFLARFHGDVPFTGVDLSATAIEAARASAEAQADNNLHFIYTPTTDYMVKQLGGQFGSVVCSEVIEHVGDDKRFMRALFRLIDEKVGSRLIITTPVEEVDDPGHLRIYTAEELASLMNRNGFYVNVHVEGTFMYGVAVREVPA